MGQPVFDSGENVTSGNYDLLTFKDIILQHIKQISILASVEFVGGYWEKKPITSNSNETIDIYHQDTRDIFINSIKCLADMLFVYFDEEMKTSENEIITEFNSLKDNSFDKTPDDLIKSSKSKYHKHNFNIKRVELYSKLFRSLMSFLYRKNYLQLGVMED